MKDFRFPNFSHEFLTAMKQGDFNNMIKNKKVRISILSL